MNKVTFLFLSCFLFLTILSAQVSGHEETEGLQNEEELSLLFQMPTRFSNSCIEFGVNSLLSELEEHKKLFIFSYEELLQLERFIDSNLKQSLLDVEILDFEELEMYHDIFHTIIFHLTTLREKQDSPGVLIVGEIKEEVFENLRFLTDRLE